MHWGLIICGGGFVGRRGGPACVGLEAHGLGRAKTFVPIGVSEGSWKRAGEGDGIGG